MLKEQEADRAEEIRVAVCGNLDTACEELRKEGIYLIDNYSDATSLAFQIREGVGYDLILVYAPEGEGLLNTSYPCKKKTEQEWNESLAIVNRLKANYRNPEKIFIAKSMEELEAIVSDLKKKQAEQNKA